MLDPTPAMRAHVEPRGVDRLGSGLVALERQCAGEDGHRKLALLEQTQQPPEADATAVLEHALTCEVAAKRTLVETVRLGEPELSVTLSILYRGLRALLVVHDEIQGETGAVRPLRIGRVAAVTN